MQLYAPNGEQIVGTLEMLSGRAEATEYEPNGKPIYSGETTVFWDAQETVEREGLVVYLSEDGMEWTFDQLWIPDEDGADTPPDAFVGKRVIYLDGPMLDRRGQAGIVRSIDPKGWLLVDFDGAAMLDVKCDARFLGLAAWQFTPVYRMGDFYEFFDDDAKAVADVLGIVVAKRDGRPMAGVPVHRWDIDKRVLRGNGILARVERRA